MAKIQINIKNMAIEEGDVSTTNLLLNAGANVNVVNKDEKTCLHILFTRNFDTDKVLSFVNLQLEKGINLNAVDKNKRSALFLAVQNCKERTTSYMMSDKRGEDPKKIVSKLIRHGANVNICDTSGETVLSMFCEQGSNIEIGELLLNSGADPSKGYCIQHVMENRLVSVNNSECINFIRRLLRKGADANKFKKGKSNVIEATKKGYRLLAEKMIKYGADVNFYDSTHQIALHHACGLGAFVKVRVTYQREFPVRLKISTGNYILQTHKASFSKNNFISPTCKLCGKADETVEHFILLCEKLEETRIPLLSKILDNGSLILAKVETSFPIDLIKLIINPFCYVDINANRAVFEETSNILEPLCRQLLYNMHNKRYALLANIDKQGSRKSNF